MLHKTDVIRFSSLLVAIVILELCLAGCTKAGKVAETRAAASTAATSDPAVATPSPAPEDQMPAIAKRNFLRGTIDEWAQSHGGIALSPSDQNWCLKKKGCVLYEKGQPGYNHSLSTLVWTRNEKIAGITHQVFNIANIADVPGYTEAVEKDFTAEEVPKFIHKFPNEQFSYRGFWPFNQGLVTATAVCLPYMVGAKKKTPPFRKCNRVKLVITDCTGRSGKEATFCDTPAQFQRHDLPW